ncbi:MAG: serine/threonine phosphatase PrpC, regulation of stationary phase [Myxococcales bacterium]|nr:serine/threonine phosphatase PrpC, regulation of stationary phase [Myxococcales bacterium]
MVTEESAKVEAASSSTPGAVEVRLAGRTDVGLIREHNEDSFVMVRLEDGAREPEKLASHTLGPRGTLLVVCDGMGGAAAGEVASGMAIDALAVTMLDGTEALAPDGVVDDEKTHLARKLRAAAREANGQIFREARENLTRSGMGTTMTAAHLWGGAALIAQVGDSRAYVWRQGAFTQVTRDQSLVNQLLETGQITVEQAKFFEHSNVILQALGVQEEVEVQLSKVELCKGDRMMMCSDGLVGVVSDEEIAAVVGSIDDPSEAARILIEMANGAGGPDNITVIVVHVDGPGLPAASEADVITFAHWRIDPDLPVERETGSESYDNFAPPSQQPTTEHRVVPPPVSPRRPTMELMSMAVVIGLILGSIVTGAALYRHGVKCQVQARTAGLTVLTDGHDSGARTADGTVELRLSPGRHTLALRAAGAGPFGDRELQVEPGQACEVSFTEPSSR